MKAITKDISLTPARAKIEEGWQQSERGEGVSNTDAREHFRKRSAEHRRKAHESV